MHLQQVYIYFENGAYNNDNVVIHLKIKMNATAKPFAESSSTPPPRLLDVVRDHLRLKHYSIRTEQQYVNWVRRFVLFHDKRHPREMGATEVSAFLTHLAVAGNVKAASTY